jgi:dephospho-CoA kinase
VRVIGLTGGIGAGKSEVAAALARLGAVVIDADHEGHEAYRSGSVGWRRIVELFTTAVLDDEGEIDRQALGSIVFNDPQALAWLNAAIHPLIRDRVEARLRELGGGGTEVAVVDAALLYQAGWDDLTEEVWLVTAPTSMVVQRLVGQRGMRASEAERRIGSQSFAGKQAQADVVIENAGTIEQLRDATERLWNERILSKR